MTGTYDDVKKEHPWRVRVQILYNEDEVDAIDLLYENEEDAWNGFEQWYEE